MPILRQLLHLLCLLALSPSLNLASPIYTKPTGKFGSVNIERIRGLISDHVRNGLSELRTKLAEQNGVSDAEQEQSNADKSPGRNLEGLMQSQQATTIETSATEMGNMPQSISDVNKDSSIREGLYQSDIILTDAQIDQKLANLNENSNSSSRKKRQSVNNIYFNLWTSGLSYSFDSSTTSAMKRAFLLGVDYWQSNTCIDFEENRYARNRVELFQGDGCYSYVSQIGGVQELSLGEGCESYGTAVHELGHALGYFHTQSRWDRDQFIKFNPENVAKDFADQFDKENSMFNDNMGEPYDYGGIMHYGAGSGAKESGLFTMVSLKKQYILTMGSPIPAFYDKKMMNRLYGCMDKCSQSQHSKCKNSGYAHPRNCNLCVCPDGYGGADCTLRDSTNNCGREIQATRTWTTINLSIEKKNATTMSDEELYLFTPIECVYWITSPKGTRIETRSQSVMTPSSQTDFVYGCALGFIELKTRANPAITGPRICYDYVDQRVDKVFRSTANLMVVRAVATYYYVDAYVQFRYV